MKITEIKPPPAPPRTFTIELSEIEIAYLYCVLANFTENNVANHSVIDKRIPRWAGRLAASFTSNPIIPNWDFARDKPEPD